MLDQKIYNEYIAILEEELIPALGCTEPIAIAYAAAKAREVLGDLPEKIIAECSGNIIKNVKGVTVPGTGDMKGIETAAILGAVCGNSSKKLEVLAEVKPADVLYAKELVEKNICEVRLIPNVAGLNIVIHAIKGDESVVVELFGSHTNIVRIEKDGQVILKTDPNCSNANAPDHSLLNLIDIYKFIEEVNIEDIKLVLDRQIEFNMNIAEEGLHHHYGANVGATLLKHYGDDVKVRARAYAAAGSDARMGGCALPVVINSGSGNQGLTASLPVVLYAKELGASKEATYRALALSNLVAIYQKNGLGKLSAYCGAVSAACGSAVAITYLMGGDREAMGRSVTNTLGNVSGIVCDGAKSSCAAKIASSLDAAIMASMMAMDNEVFGVNEGLVKGNVEDTIRSIARMGRDGMRDTDIEILNIMIGK